MAKQNRRKAEGPNCPCAGCRPTFGPMAGQPMLRKLSRFIEDHGGDQFILDRIAAGESVGKIAKSITLPGATKPISRPFLYTWRDKSEERRAGWDLAMKASGHALAEEAGDILDELVERGAPSSADVALARARSNYKQWLAGRRNREEYGEDRQQAAVVNLNVGALHLDALRAHGQAPRPLAVAPDPLLIEGEYDLGEG